ncbi:DNA adenine methylase [Acinetobacter courvalinii]|uniref:DNA adenine methylase n=1 Tax=Acinetobacter courvalinii TaxID=280147 RepID=UPI00190169D4|nr:DNA adenine methylase [Acinetobacter courvalinii]MBJ9956074.1 DNA adenine methylase [Acinetobacter courvalinii]
MPNFFTPLRYPGGKGKFAKFVKNLFEANNLSGDYLEPYAGGAGVALDLLFSNSCNNIHINDFDIAVYNFWKTVTEDTENFLKLLCDIEVTIDEWHRQKYILSTPELHTQLEHGFATFFLNRTNRSGILKGGVIGGKNQDGNYKLDARFHKENLSKRIEKIGQFSNRIKIYNLDALELLKKVDDFLPDESLIYLDPPYYVKGQGLYRNFYIHEDHLKIREALDRVNTKWIVSYDNCDPIKEIYSGYAKDEYVLNYSAHSTSKGNEIMFFCDSIIPVDLPNKLKQAELDLN